MPVAREKGARRRTASNSSDCGQLQGHFSPPRPQFFTGPECEPSDADGIPGTSRPVADPIQQCCSPRCCMLTEIDPISPDAADMIKMVCSNEKCLISPFMHAICFTAYEEQMLSFLRGMSRARNWSEKQRKQNLWTKKGYDLIYKMCTCRCAKGSLKHDLSYTAGPDDKGKRKRKKSASGEKMSVPIRAGNGAQRARTRTIGRCNSDSISSENGSTVPGQQGSPVSTSSSTAAAAAAAAYMQPFAHRTDYKIFEKVLPRHLVNSYHIKMEDDGYGAGDDTRSFVLSSLAFHHSSFVSCILCSAKMTVYDQFPLIDGTFFLSPRPSDSALAVESKGNDEVFLTTVCLNCLAGINEVTCTYCSKRWDGNAHQIGTMYSYDLFASFPCCLACVQCNNCKQALVEPGQVSLSFSQLSSRVKCSHCSAYDYHFIKPIARFKVRVSAPSK